MNIARLIFLNASLIAIASIPSLSAASTPSVTTLSSNPTIAYRTSPNDSLVLTATVTTGATGTITFQEGSTNLNCSEGAQPRPLTGNQASCTLTFSAEGVHALSASYSGNATFGSSSGSANVYVQNHAANTGTTYCNAGAISNNGRSDLAFSNTAPYPSVIFVGDGVNTDIANSVVTVSLRLKSFFANGAGAIHMLLVAPDQTHAFDFWSNIGGTASAGDYTLTDFATLLPGGFLSPGTYGPTAEGSAPDSFTPAAPTPAPQIPGSFSYAIPAGSSTFQSAFTGAPAHGAWSLFLYNASGATTVANAAGGWCLTISPNPSLPTTVAIAANPTVTTPGMAVTFMAGVTSAGQPAINRGVVSFTENGFSLAGAPDHGVTNVSNGVATIATSALSTGNHTVTATYHDSVGTYADDSDAVQVTVNKAASATKLTTACPTTFVADQPFTMTAAVTGYSPTGSSTFYADGNPVVGCASLALGSGMANCSTSTLPPGVLELSATYGGDANNTVSNSVSLFVSVLAPSDALFRNAFEAAVAGCARE